MIVSNDSKAISQSSFVTWQSYVAAASENTWKREFAHL
jgi:hypothetical protein